MRSSGRACAKPAGSEFLPRQRRQECQKRVDNVRHRATKSLANPGTIGVAEYLYAAEATSLRTDRIPAIRSSHSASNFANITIAKT